MNTSKLILLTAILSIFIALGLVHVFTLPPIPGARDTLPGAEIIHLVGAVGPESLAFDPNGGGPYTGVADGRILKWEGEDRGWTEFAITSPADRKECGRPLALEMEHICGRPLGLRFHKKTGDLYIANAYFGLQKVGPNGGLATQLVTEAEDEPFRFTNDLDIDEEDDVIYFTDTSTTYQRSLGQCKESDDHNRVDATHEESSSEIEENPEFPFEIEDNPGGQTIILRRGNQEEDITVETVMSSSWQFIIAVLLGDRTARLMKYNIATKEVKVLMRGLAFGNGVALNKDRSFVLVAETTGNRILRYWLQGPKAGTWDTFADLPGTPDNIRRNPKGEFWVALHCKNGMVANWILTSKNSWVGKTLVKLPLSFKQLHPLLVGGKAHASVMKLSEEGEVVEVLEDSEGKSLKFVSEVEERNGELWLGSVLVPYIGKYKLVA